MQLHPEMAFQWGVFQLANTAAGGVVSDSLVAFLRATPGFDSHFIVLANLADKDVHIPKMSAFVDAQRDALRATCKRAASPCELATSGRFEVSLVVRDGGEFVKGEEKMLDDKAVLLAGHQVLVLKFLPEQSKE